MIRGVVRTPGGHGATVPRQGRGVPGPCLSATSRSGGPDAGGPIIPFRGMPQCRLCHPGLQRRTPHLFTPPAACPISQPSAPRATGAARPLQSVRTTLVWGTGLVIRVAHDHCGKPPKAHPADGVVNGPRAVLQREAQLESLAPARSSHEVAEAAIRRATGMHKLGSVTWRGCRLLPEGCAPVIDDDLEGVGGTARH